MKTIGIIGAMEEEVAILKSRLEIITAKNIVGVEFYMGNLNGKNTVLVRSGIGKVNAAVCTQVLSDIYGVDCVINTGVAGALHPSLGICDVVVSSDVVQHDFDASGFGYKPGIIPRMPVSYFPADEELARMAMEACAETAPNQTAMHGRITSGDLFVSDAAVKQKIHKAFDALCVEMEGAAIGHACYLNKIPFIIIRSMSDAASGSAEVDYNAFAAQAAEQSSAIVERMIKDIS
ncbi:MAG: 5'-methylthioadenosine/adenosylhomocysteine nucleosidase [Clostridiales bacterium]|jgi:adenosylhomocysteine nucleosidase|nr:5'-methylthioadenosine/adenosylhomocysteine nucleosidase [Clostridiales bacterium]